MGLVKWRKLHDTNQKQAHSTRLTLKELILMGILAVDKLDDAARQELADRVHQMQVQGEI